MKDIRRPMLGAAYYPEAWEESQQDYDIAMMVKAGITVVRMGEFAWRKMEPREGEYDFSWLHRVMDKLDAAGIRVILGTPTATPPIWLEEMDPTMMALDENGLRRQHGGRRNCCSNHRGYVDYCLKITEKMAQEFGSDPRVIGWQIDNEIAAFGAGCFCPNCIREFHRHLQDRYGTVEELNRRWNLHLFSQAYDSFDQVPAPRTNMWHSPHLRFEWNTFQMLSHTRFVKHQADLLHRYTQAPVGTDMMPTLNQDYERMNEFLDVVQYNHYDDEHILKRELFWYDYMRPIKSRPFWVTETSTCWNGGTGTPSNIRPEGFCRANSWLPIVLGAEANMYWLWRQHWAGHELMHGSVLYASGRPLHIFPEVQQLAAEFARCSDFLENTRVSPDLALLVSTDADYLMREQPVVWEPDCNEWETAYFKRVNRMYDVLRDMGLRTDVINPGKPLEEYQVLFTPFLLTLELGDLSDRIVRWVEQGGTWIAGPMTDIRDSIGTHYTDRETGILETLTGARLVQQVPDAEHRIPCRWTDGGEFQAEKWLQLYEVPADVRVLATAEGYHSALVGKALVFEKKLGKGSILVLGTEPSAEDAARLIRDAVGLKPQFKVEGAVAAARRTGTNIRGIAAQEYGGKPGKLFLNGTYTDLITAKTWDHEIPLAPYQTVILRKDG